MTPSSSTSPILLCLTGDVMTGRGIDQILPHPGAPELYERHVHDARDYVRLAEAENGPIPAPVDFAYPWGDALPSLLKADARIINLETSITGHGTPWPGKGIHYRMHPLNTGCLTAARVTCCGLANNHVLDWGRDGLVETLETLEHTGLAYAGAGRDAVEASAIRIIDLPGKGRVLVYAAGSDTSGIPPAWRAATGNAGVNLLEDLSTGTARHIADHLLSVTRPDDVTIVSLHWGGNWGYDIPQEQVAFAHRLADEGVDIVHGHSAHHVKAIELRQRSVILYGCGDFLTDYEGIHGHEAYRGTLALAFLVSLETPFKRTARVELAPFRVRRMRLEHAPEADTHWLHDRLNRECARFGTEVAISIEGRLLVRPRR